MSHYSTKLKSILESFKLEAEKIDRTISLLEKIPADKFIYPANLATTLQIDVDTTNDILLILCKFRRLLIYTVPYHDNDFFEEYAVKGILDIEEFSDIEQILEEPDLEGVSIDQIEPATAYRVYLE